MKKEHLISLITLMLACSVFLASCSGDTSSNSSPTLPASNGQSSTTTPISKAQAACLTVNSPSLVKLTDGNYKLVEEIDNCSSNDAGPLKMTAYINTETTQQSTNLMGPSTIPANGKAMYQTFTGQTGSANKEIHFLSPSSSALVTVSVTINSVIRGEWDGQVTIPAH